MTNFPQVRTASDECYRLDLAAGRRILSPLHRHRHPNPVHGLVLKGRWHYLEHDWVAEEGPYIFEPSGETHTLTVPEGVDEMITFFHVTGCLYYIDPDGNPLGYDDVFTLIEDCRAYYTKVGLGADFVDQFIR